MRKRMRTLFGKGSLMLRTKVGESFLLHDLLKTCYLVEKDCL